MLQVLLYGNIDKEVKYACTEMLNHIGVPYREVDNLRFFTSQDDASYVLLLPETARIERHEVEVLRRSRNPFILTGYVPEELSSDIGCRIARMKGVDPPRISGLLRLNNGDSAPFFYKFPILEFEEHKLQKVGEIELENEVYTSVVLSEQDNRSFAIITPQLFRSAAYLLAGSEATLPYETLESLGLIDKLGRIDGRKTEICLKGFLYIPIVNIYEKLLLKILKEFSNRTKNPLIQKWFHPQNHDLTVCLMHDVECVVSPQFLDGIVSFKAGKVMEGVARCILAFSAFIFTIFCKLRVFESKNSLRLLPQSLAHNFMRYNPIWNFDEYLKTERQFGATSSFNFLTNQTDKNSDYDFHNPLIKKVMKSLIKSGWEACLHGSFYSYNDGKKAKEEKAALEKVLEMKVAGITQHFLRMAVPETWRYQEEAGFTYDATFGYAQEVGFRAGTCLPFNPWDFKRERKLSILEISQDIMDGTLFQKDYLALSDKKGFEICKELVDIVQKYNGVLTLNWHSSINRERDRSWFELYPKILAYCLRYNPWFTSGERLAEWWNLRRLISFEEVSGFESELEFYVNSPRNYEGFSVKIYIPINFKDIKLFVNDRKLGKEKVVKENNVLLFFFDVLKGRNKVKLMFKI